MPPRFLKGSHSKVADFRRGRQRQSDEAYLADLSITDQPLEREVALAVRRAVASVGLVDPLYIRADDRASDELAVLPLWDSMEWVALLLELEEELSLAIPDREAEQIKVSNFSVRSCVRDTIKVVRRLRAA